jgi:hypothetical protein
MLIKISRNRCFLRLCLLLFFILICICYYLNNPSESNFFIPCFFKAISGLNCAGCGGQRAFHLLLHGNFLQALRYNFLIYFSPFFLYLLFLSIEIYIFKSKKYVSKFIFSNKLGLIILAVITIYTVLRNIPYEPFIYLSPPK